MSSLFVLPLYICYFCFVTDPNVTSASYRKVFRTPGNDFSATYGESIELDLPGRPIPVKEEFIELKLKTANGKIYMEFLLQAVRQPKIILQPKSATELDLSLLIIGIDSISNGHAQRKLPKSYKFMKDVLDSYIFMGHSVVGDGTTEQLAALLTGKGERDYADSRRKIPGAKPVDDWNWIFKNAKGYRFILAKSYSTPLHSTPLQSTLFYFTPLHFILLYSTPLYSTLLQSTLFYFTPLHFSLLYSSPL